MEGQDENGFISIMRILLNIIGAIYITFVAYIAFRVIKELLRRRNIRESRLSIVNQMQSIPFGNLAFDPNTNCSICFEPFNTNDQVLQLKCHNSHIFHTECIKEWVR